MGSPNHISFLHIFAYLLGLFLFELLKAFLQQKKAPKLLYYFLFKYTLCRTYKISLAHMMFKIFKLIGSEQS